MNGLATADTPFAEQKNTFADLTIGDRLIREADGGGGHESIWETPSKNRGHDR